MKHSYLGSAVVAMAVVLLGGSTSQAQSYFYGYYYPESHRFHTNDVAGNGYDSYDPANAALYDLRYGPTQPATTAQPASIRLLLPDPSALVYFDDSATKSTGASRLFTTPPLEPGLSSKYKLKVTWTKSGREFSVSREVEVAAGHTVVLNLSHPAAAATMKPAGPAKK